MNHPSADPSENRSYSPFWALLLLFAALIFLQISYVVADFNQKSRIQAARTQLKPVLTQAQTVSQTTEAVGRELIALSVNSAEAARIIAEFKIKQNAPPQPASEK